MQQEELTPEQEQAQNQMLQRLAQTSVFEKQVQILEAENANLRSQLAETLVARENDAHYIEQLQTQIFEAQNAEEQEPESKETQEKD